MRQGLVTTLVGPMFLIASYALAQTPAPAPGAPGAPAGGLADYWWVILLVLIAAGAAWYFMKGRNRV
jgi:uncharacterized protein HemX